jgi:WD40 repeat protein
LEAILLEHTNDIVNLSFLEPYACLVSASNDGIICLWGLKQDLNNKYEVMAKF